MASEFFLGKLVSAVYFRVLLMSGSAVMGVQCEQEGADHTALGGSNVEHYSRGGVTATLSGVCL